ncbi:hypothetical protein METEAL_23450 [Mesoterricola silvestris]|uniref:Diguanylate cyclase n=2 Tax=Mesoterricola silvestris TaxID=2927979 RepID=A0AA48GWJ8_9BACT|nr:hypothetical protein METEAL_23450 [Mesoterricola silvestris]
MGRMGTATGQRRHLATLDPIRPEDAPDAWEREALLALNQGRQEVFAPTVMAGQPTLRYMGTLTAEDGCLHCHAGKGAHAGDVLGGISIAVPLDTLRATLAQRHQMAFQGALAILWFMGLGGLWVTAKRDQAFQVANLRALEELKASKDRYQLISENAADVVWLLDLPSQRFSFVSPSVHKVTGYTVEEFLQHPLDHFLTAESVQEARARLEVRIQTVREGDAARLTETNQLDLIRLDGVIVPLEVRTTLLAGPDGSFATVLGVSHDITERKAAYEALHKSEELFSRAFSLSPDAVCISRLKDGVYIAINNGFTRILGYSADRILGRSSTDPANQLWDQVGDRQSWVAVLEAQGEYLGLEAVFRTQAGRPLTGLMSAKVIEVNGETCILSIIRDITEQREAARRLKEAQDLNQKLLEASPLGIAAYRADTGQCVLANPALSTILGGTQEQFLAQNFRTISSWKGSGLLAAAEACLAGHETARVTLEFDSTFGKHLWIFTSMEPFEASQEPHLLVMIEDVTERVLGERRLLDANAKLDRLAREDALTGLGNRRAFNERLETEVRRTRRAGKSLSIIMGDIDYFKRYNDHYGHPMGDACLITVAEIMQDLFKRSGDLVARIGGEEFAILLPETPLEAAAQLAATLREAIQAAGIPHEASGIAEVVTLSIGVASTNLSGDALPSRLLKLVDGALYQSKKNGRNRVFIAPSQE